MACLIAALLQQAVGVVSAQTPIASARVFTRSGLLLAGGQKSPCMMETQTMTVFPVVGSCPQTRGGSGNVLFPPAPPSPLVVVVASTTTFPPQLAGAARAIRVIVGMRKV